MATYPKSPQPTFAGFSDWIYAIMGVPVAWLPTDSPYIEYAYNTAVAIVNPVFITVPGPIYLQCVYNLGGHLLATWAIDPEWARNGDLTGNPPLPYIIVDGVAYGFFQWLRKANNMSGFTTGTVSASSDNGSSVTLVVPEAMKNLTLSQLQLLTSPWGRTYLGYAQDWGQPWGIS